MSWHGRLFLALAAATGIASTPPAFAVTCLSQASTAWATTTTWLCGGVNAVPTAVDDVTIQSAHTVNMNGNPGAAQSLTIAGIATWNTNNRTTNVGTGGITVNSGGDIAGSNGGAVLTTTGNLSINAVTTSTVADRKSVV